MGLLPFLLLSSLSFICLCLAWSNRKRCWLAQVTANDSDPPSRRVIKRVEFLISSHFEFVFHGIWSGIAMSYRLRVYTLYYVCAGAKIDRATPDPWRRRRSILIFSLYNKRDKRSRDKRSEGVRGMFFLPRLSSWFIEPCNVATDIVSWGVEEARAELIRKAKSTVSYTHELEMVFFIPVAKMWDFVN